MKTFYFTLIVAIISFQFQCSDKKKQSVWGFSLGLEPIVFDPETQNPDHPKTGKRMDMAEDCGSCHETVYNNWKESRHKVAFTNELYRHSHTQEPMTWCVNCHAPLIEPGKDIENPEERFLSGEGINCHVCHVRNKKIITSRLPKLKNDEGTVHEYQVETEFADSSFCASCHQFNFPKLKKGSSKERILYSHLPMQNTYEEFQSTEMRKFGNCQDCHVLSHSSMSHSFPGGHNRSKLAESLHIEVERVGSKTILVHVISNGIAHAFPTGDLFRTLKVSVKNESGKIISILELKKYYRDTISTQGIDENLPSRIQIGDTRIPPPGKGYVSQNSFLIEIDPDEKFLTISLDMDYLNPSSRILLDIPYEKTVLSIKTIRVLVPPHNGSSG